MPPINPPFPKPDKAQAALTAQQIVYLDYPGGRLYGEVIQVVSSHDRCWVRPLAHVGQIAGEPGPAPLPSSSPNSSPNSPNQAGPVQDLRCGPDIIWPLRLFTAALDQDWLAVLPQLPEWTPGEDRGCDRAQTNALLHQLLRTVEGLAPAESN